MLGWIENNCNTRTTRRISRGVVPEHPTGMRPLDVDGHPQVLVAQVSQVDLRDGRGVKRLLLELVKVPSRAVPPLLLRQLLERYRNGTPVPRVSKLGQFVAEIGGKHVAAQGQDLSGPNPERAHALQEMPYAATVLPAGQTGGLPAGQPAAQTQQGIRANQEQKWYRTYQLRQREGARGGTTTTGGRSEGRSRRVGESLLGNISGCCALAGGSSG